MFIYIYMYIICIFSANLISVNFIRYKYIYAYFNISNIVIVN